jgi:hypothetical protein
MSRSIEASLHRTKVQKFKRRLATEARKYAGRIDPSEQPQACRAGEDLLLRTSQHAGDVCDDVAVSCHDFAALIERALDASRRNPVPKNGVLASQTAIIQAIDTLLNSLEHICQAVTVWMNVTTQTLQSQEKERKKHQDVSSDVSEDHNNTAKKSFFQRTMKRGTVVDTMLPGEGAQSGERLTPKETKEKKAEEKDRNALFVGLPVNNVVALVSAQLSATAKCPRRGTVLEEQYVQPVSESQSTALGNFFSTKIQVIHGEFFVWIRVL